MKNNKIFYILIIILSSILFSQIPINKEKLQIRSFLFNDKFEYKQEKEKKYKYPGKAMIYSALLPGLGELYAENWKRALIFSTIEMAAVSTWYINNQESIEQTDDYKRYADENWDFFRWMENYYNWKDSDDYAFLFSNTSEDELEYENIWDGSHYLTFSKSSSNGEIIIMQTVDQSGNYDPNSEYNFSYYYDMISQEPHNDLIDELFSDSGFFLLKDSHFYENVFKYNHFFSGWEDHELIEIYDNDGYMIARSPKKWKYRSMRDQVAKLQRIANYAITTVMFNHIASMIDAVFVTRNYNSKLNIAALPMYNPEQKYGIGGIKISLIW